MRPIHFFLKKMFLAIVTSKIGYIYITLKHVTSRYVTQFFKIRCIPLQFLAPLKYTIFFDFPPFPILFPSFPIYSQLNFPFCPSSIWMDPTPWNKAPIEPHEPTGNKTFYSQTRPMQRRTGLRLIPLVAARVNDTSQPWCGGEFGDDVWYIFMFVCVLMSVCISLHVTRIEGKLALI